MDTPRKTKLYNQIAKDYLPKQADMMICRYIEGLERRIEALESKDSEPEQHEEAQPEESKPAAKGRKKDVPDTADPATV